MDNTKIVHFVGFVTTLDFEDFTPLWESYMKNSIGVPVKITLEETSQKSPFRYVSQHESSTTDVAFSFMKENSRLNFPDRKARVVQAGGYTPVEFRPKRHKIKDEIKVIVFIPHGERDLGFYRQQTFHHLNIYEAYFENCTYGYVMEFFVNEPDAPELIIQLKTRPGVEAAVYKKCRVISHSKKTSGSLL
jgi:hypothetical protein